MDCGPNALQPHSAVCWVGWGRVEPALRARAPLSLAPYNHILQWSGWAESNVLQHHFVAALQRAVGLTFCNPFCSGLSGSSLVLYTPTLSQLLQWAVGLALYNPILQWSGWAEHNVLQPHCVAALQWAESNVSQPPLPQL